MLKKILNVALLSLPFILVFIASIYQPNDPDLGWHLKYGEYFFKNHQLLQDNTFSTMMAYYKWPNSSWGTDLISYAIFSPFGFFGLSIATAFIITFIFYFASKAANLDHWEKTLLFPILLYFEKPVNAVSFRGQLISILLTTILFYLINQFKNNPSKKILLTIPLFALWVNIHGQYLIGLFIFALWVFINSIVVFFENQSNIKKTFNKTKYLLTAFIGSCLATLINPYGIGMYLETFKYFGNPDLKFVAEYLPFNSLSSSWWNHYFLGMLLLLGFLFLYFSNELKKQVTTLSVVAILYTLSLSVRRYAWTTYYLTLPVLKPLANFFKPDTQKYQLIASTVISLIIISIVLVLKMPLTQFTQMNWDQYCNYYQGCSPQAMQYLLTHPTRQPLLSFYDWGGYMIWNYPQIKPSIDGRMHLWKDASGYSGFDDYYAYEQDLKNVDESSYNTVLMTTQKPLFDQLVRLREQDKWVLLYKDDKAAIFERKY